MTAICFLVVQLITGYFPVFTESLLVRTSHLRSKKRKQKQTKNKQKKTSPVPQYSHSIQSLQMNKVLSFFIMSQTKIQIIV